MNASQPVTMSFPCLQVVRGELGSAVFVLDRSPLRLGRDSAQSEVVLPQGDPRISRQHCELVQEFGRWILVDHSRNGVVINQTPVHNDRLELQHGDHIHIGDSVELLFDDPNSTYASSSLLSVPPSKATSPSARGLYFDPHSLSVWRDAVRLDVSWSPQELALLRFLFQRPDQVCGYADVIAAVWGAEATRYGREHVQELVGRVRRKLEPEPAQPIYLLTRPGHGYMLTLTTITP